MVSTSFPVQVLLGVYLGLLTGIVPALISWGLGFLFKYFTGVTIPGFGLVAVALAVAGVNGGILALTDQNIQQSTNETALLVGIIVILMLSLYAHAKGDAMGASMPKRINLRDLTERTLSADVVDLGGGRGQVRVVVTGAVDDMEGYPPLPADLRGRVGEFAATLPADVPLVELESKVADRLRTEFDLADVSVRLDERAHASVAAAPPVGALSKRVPAGKRAVSLSTLLPTGLARGDEVTVVTDGGRHDGTVVSAKSSGGAGGAAGPGGSDAGASADPAAATDGGTDAPPAPASPAAAGTTTGGEGRVTLAVERAAARALVGATVNCLVVRSRGTRQEFELVSLLRRVGRRFRRLTVRADGPLDGRTLADAGVRAEYDVAVLAVRADGRWTVAPGGAVALGAGDDLVAVGTTEALNRFAAEVA